MKVRPSRWATIPGKPTRLGRSPVECTKKASKRLLYLDDLFPDLVNGLFLKGFLPLLRIIAAPGIKTPDKPDSILRSKGIDQGIIPFALDPGNGLPFHQGSTLLAIEIIGTKGDAFLEKTASQHGTAGPGTYRRISTCAPLFAICSAILRISRATASST